MLKSKNRRLYLIVVLTSWVVTAPARGSAAEEHSTHVIHLGNARILRNGKMVSGGFAIIDGCIYETIWDLEQVITALPSGSELTWYAGFSYGGTFYLGRLRMKTAQLDQFCREQGVGLVLQGGF